MLWFPAHCCPDRIFYLFRQIDYIQYERKDHLRCLLPIRGCKIIPDRYLSVRGGQVLMDHLLSLRGCKVRCNKSFHHNIVNQFHSSMLSSLIPGQSAFVCPQFIMKQIILPCASINNPINFWKLPQKMNDWVRALSLLSVCPRSARSGSSCRTRQQLQSMPQDRYQGPTQSA